MCSREWNCGEHARKSTQFNFNRLKSNKLIYNRWKRKRHGRIYMMNIHWINNNRFILLLRVFSHQKVCGTSSNHHGGIVPYFRKYYGISTVNLESYEWLTIIHLIYSQIFVSLWMIAHRIKLHFTAITIQQNIVFVLIFFPLVWGGKIPIVNWVQSV